MSDQETIAQLQKEIERLSRDLAHYQHQVDAMRAAVNNLYKGAGMYQPAAATQKPILPKTYNLENFIGLKLIHLVGIVVLVIGLSIGVKYAIDSNLISERARILLAYAAGVILFSISVPLRSKYAGFSAILFSGAMASIYFTTYAAFTYYGIFSFPAAFIFMILLTLFTVYKAISYNLQEIALLGLVGAYGIPFLVSKNADRADLFFLYIALINVAVIYLYVRKYWKLVGGVAQSVTWFIFIGWATMRFNINMQLTALGFMIFFFLLFHAGLILPKILYKKPISTTDAYMICINNIALYIGALLVMGNAFTDNAVATISFIVSLFTGLQALVLYHFWKEENYTATLLGVISLILFLVFIAFRWEGLSVTLLWLLTAVAVFISGAVKKWGAARMAAIFLMGATLLKLVLLDSMTFNPIQKIISYVVLGVLLLIVSFFYQKFTEALSKGKD